MAASENFTFRDGDDMTASNNPKMTFSSGSKTVAKMDGAFKMVIMSFYEFIRQPFRVKRKPPLNRGNVIKN